MRIGILTYHRAINMGSIVQAYCLQKKLRNDYPEAVVEIVDYRPGLRDWRESTKHLTKRWPFFNARRWAEVRSIRKFGEEVLNFSPSHATTRNMRYLYAWLDALNYDALFVGSDTVWEYRPNSYSPPEPNIFHLPWQLRAKKFSFAASADPVPPDGIQNPGHRDAIAKAINEFDVVGVRDDATIGMLQKIGIDTGRVHKVLDPTLHVDFDELASEYRIHRNGNNPLAGVALPPSVAAKTAEVLRAAGYDVWNWGTATPPWCDGHLNPNMTASEVLGAYRNLATFVTDRFHGSIFSLRVGGIAPIFIETEEKWPAENSKGRELYQCLGLGERVLRNDMPAWPVQLAELVQSPAKAPEARIGYNSDYDRAVRAVLMP